MGAWALRALAMAGVVAVAVFARDSPAAVASAVGALVALAGGARSRRRRR
jgi:hypothetical protein